MNKNLCFTLAHNLVSETEIATKLLYDQNDRSDFEHLIIDLGFPLESANEIPDDIFIAREHNTDGLKELANRFGSRYMKMENIGVSQNWTQVYRYLKPDDTDILIGVDPDERPQALGWVRAMGSVMRAGGFALASLGQTEHKAVMFNIKFEEKQFNEYKAHVIYGVLNWALIGISGKFLNIIRDIPYPIHAPRYGWIEGALMPLFEKHNMNWCVLPDYEVVHTCNSPIYGEWKMFVASKFHEYGQPDFATWLNWKKDGKI